MRGIKPFKLGLLTRPFEYNRAYHLGVTVTLCVRFGETAQVVTDVEMWDLVGEELGATPLDFGIPKSRAEVLVTGHCFQPNGREAATCPVEFHCADIHKQLYVLGDRHWHNGVPSPPTPFTTMPIDWAHAYGGEGFEKNPLGRGAVEVPGPDGKPMRPLPNIEKSGHLMTSPHEHPEPAGFHAVDFLSPHRQAMVGTYDAAWREEYYPGFAKDIDWRMWNAAPPDQQREAFFRGDEPLRFLNMHPTQPMLEARLPGLCGRAFYTLKPDRDAPAGPLTELPLHLTTVWAFPHKTMAILLFQGAIEVTEDDGADVDTIMIAADRLGALRSVEHYQAVHLKRTGDEAKDNPAVHLQDDDLVPPDLMGLSPETQSQMDLLTNEGIQAKRQRAAHQKEVERGRAVVEAMGLDPDEHGPSMPDPPEEPPKPHELGKLLETAKAELAKHQEEMLAHKEQEVARVGALYEEMGFDFEELRAQMESPPEGPPTFRADEQRAQLRQMADDAAARGTPSEELEKYASDEAWYQQLKDGEARLFEAYRATAHFTGAASAKDDAANAAIRAEVEDAVQRGQSLGGRDFTGANLSEMVLSEADFTGAFLESVSFRGTDLRGAKLDGAVMAHADFTDAKLEGTSLSQSNLGHARFERASASGVDFSSATLWENDFRTADLNHANLQQGIFHKIDLRGANLSHANLERACFIEAQLGGVNMTGANLITAFFYKAHAAEVDFGGAQLRQATFMESVMDRASFLNASLEKMICVGEGGSWHEVDLRGVNLRGANLRGQDLQRSDFSGAQMDKADLSLARLNDCRFYRAVAKESLWLKADLRGAQMVSIDLFRALLQKADLRGTDLRGANLYAADFALIRTDDGTNITDTIRGKVRAIPRRRES